MEWRPVKGFEGEYDISDKGHVRNSVTGTMRASHITPEGYRGLSLYRKGKSFTRYIHRLIAESFIPNDEHKREVNHKDGNKLNNDLDNLEWATTSENVIHALGLRLMPSGERHVQSKLSDSDTEYIRAHYKPRDKEYSAKQLAQRFNVSIQLISAITTGVARKWV